MKPILNSQQLRIFVTLTRCLSFTGAAQELGLTQSAVSHAISTLEADLGCRLVDRGHQSLRLTAGGAALLVRAERILDEMAVARAEVAPSSEKGIEGLAVVAGERVAARR